jgi:putative heme-binding domain-containing protein
LTLIEAWITRLGGNKVQLGKSDLPPSIDKVLMAPQSAMRIARQVGRGELQLSERRRVLAAAAELPPGPMRDLLEGYLPLGDNAARKLGSNPRPKAILALRGDAAAGEKLFFSQTLNCSSCHTVAGRGTAVGPDLSAIGKLRPRADLLESILEPSRRIEPKYAAYVAQTHDGRALTGLLVRRDERSVVLRDAQNKEVILAASDLDLLQPSRVSLMPAGQLAGLTAQDAADLLEFLATRR